MRPSAAMVRRGVEKNRMILFNLFDYKRGLALSNISDHKYSNKPPSPLQVTKGLKAKAGGGGFFSVSGKKDSRLLSGCSLPLYSVIRNNPRPQTAKPAACRRVRVSP